MADSNFIIKFLAEFTEAQKNLESFAKQTADTVKKINTGFSAIKINAFLDLIAKGIQIVSSLGDAFKAPIDNALEADEAINKLNLSLKLSGDFSQKASQEFLALGEQLQNTTIYSDDVVASSIAIAKNLGVTNDQAKRLTIAAADLSAVTGNDLPTSVNILAKSLEGSGAQLARQIPALKGLTEEQLKNGVAIDFIATRYKGAAEALGNTFTGALAQSKNAFSDLLEPIGQLITQNPIIVSGIKIFTESLRSLKGFIDQNKDSITSFVGTAIVGFLEGIAAIGEITAGTIRGLGVFFTFAIKGFLGLYDAVTFLLKPILVVADFLSDALVKGLSVMVIGVLELLKVISDLPGVTEVFKSAGIDVNKMSDGINKANTQILKFADSFDTKKLRDGGRQLVGTLAENLPAGANIAATAIDNLSGKIQSFADKSKGQIGTVIKGIADSVNNSAKTSLFNPKDIADAIKKGFDAGLSSPALLSSLSIEVGNLKISTTTAEFLGVGAKIATSILQGAKGAQALISSTVAGFAEKLAPGLGAVVGPIIDALAQGPVKVREMVNEFVKSIPLIIQNILLAVPAIIISLVESIPVLIDGILASLPQIVEGFVASIPVIIDALAELQPRVIQAFVDNLPVLISAFALLMPQVSTALATSLISQAPSIGVQIAAGFITQIPAIVAGIAEGAKNAISNITGGLGGGGGGILGKVVNPVASIGKKLKFADGGVIPGGFPNDTFPAQLTSGEGVVPNDTMRRLDQYLTRADSGGGGSSGGTTIIKLVIGEQELANVLLNLNRQGFRT